MSCQAPHYLDENDEVVVLPYTFEICSACRGHGRSSAYMDAFTADEMAEQGPDFFEEYMAGTFDRHCDDCDGTGKVKVADYSRMTKAQRDKFEADLEGEREWRAEVEAERRMGC